jgi:hypothetical protein
VGITEVNVAGDVKLYADLGLVGYVNLNNLTMAVPRVMDVL